MASTLTVPVGTMASGTSRAGESVDGLVDGAVAADGADEVEPLLHGLAREARGVAHALGLALVDVVAEAAQGVDDQRQVAVIGAAARVRVVDRHEMPADAAASERLREAAGEAQDGGVAGLPRRLGGLRRTPTRPPADGGRPSRRSAGCRGRGPRRAGRAPGRLRRPACAARPC